MSITENYISNRPTINMPLTLHY